MFTIYILCGIIIYMLDIDYITFSGGKNGRNFIRR